MKHFFSLSVLLISSSFFLSCKHKLPDQVTLSDTLFYSPGEPIGENLAPTEERPAIYYGLYSPADVSSIFERNNIGFNPSILNPVENLSSYSGTSKLALNLGIYGADLSYIKIFQDPQLTTKYFQAILEASEKLGIPPDLLQNAAARIENNVDNPDSLNLIAGYTFQEIIRILDEEDREETAFLMITGGWIEAMHIALQELLASNDEGLIRNIIEQKFALEYLLSSLKNHYNNPSVAYYYRMLFVLQKYYKKCRIAFSTKDFEIDRDTKTIQFAQNTLYYNDKDLERIKNIIKSIREIIIE